MIALRHYRPHAGARFGSYATWWIKNRMSAFVQQERWITRIPDYLYRQVIALTRAIARFSQENGREPGTSDLASLMACPEPDVIRLMAWLNVDRVSLDAPVGENGKSTLADFIADHQRDFLGTAELEERVRDILRTLSPREEKILRMYFGLDRDQEWTTVEIARAFGVPVSSVHYIKSRTLSKLRSPARIRRSLAAWRLAVGSGRWD